MRKLILQMQMSVDGFVGRGVDGPSWQVWDWTERCTWDPHLMERFNRFVAEADTILLSRKIMQEGYLQHWTDMANKFPARAEFAFARRITEIKKVIFSKTLNESPWPGCELAQKSLTEEVRDLKAKPGKNIIAFGGAGFASSLIAHNLVDEFQFYTNPVALGQGVSIFPQKVETRFQLVEAEAFLCGLVVSTYQRRNEKSMRS